MPKQVIILERLEAPGMAFRYAMWAAVPAARQIQYADENKTSAFNGINVQELTDLRAGVFVERVETGSWASGTPIATIQAELQSNWQKYQNFINASNPWQRYGSYWDGAQWVLANGA